ncbi:MAG: DNA mismatch repair endonuclease MutL, partial [Planctomycetota bacterium]|nr:DNA mismatch repair endonuclease MutL [Planctomycetota bacterium]
MSILSGNRINVLPGWLVNKIAAGEIIERPASCVKELIENALDAGADEIQITVREGGKKLIKVVDNGCGITPEDLPLLFKSHSTSKITTEQDLYNINTFGFRGEAMASIASVAQVRLVSKHPEHSEGWEIRSGHGQERTDKPQPVAGVNGTMVEIANLFYQTPARRKFLKSDSVELSHISDVISRYAIAYPEVGWSLISLSRTSLHPSADKTAGTVPVKAGQILINLPKSICQSPDETTARADIIQRLVYFYGDDVSKELVYNETKTERLSIRAYFSTPTYTRPTSKYQFFYLNRRFIRDRIISRAIYQAYYNLIPSGRYPFVLLFLEIPADEFDVNVHPTKIEVRFKNGWKLHDEVISLIRNRLVSSFAGAPASP